MARTQWIACDFDHTAWNNDRQEPMEGFKEALERFHERGCKVIIYSCNNPSFIRKMCHEHGLMVDAIWGEGTMDHGAKPMASCYLDDRALQFRGNWAESTKEVLEFIEGRPVRR